MSKKKTYDPAKKMIATRIDRGLLMQFDATAKARKLHRTDAMEAAMRTWMNGKAEVVCGAPSTLAPPSALTPGGITYVPSVERPVGFDAITGDPIFKSGVGPQGGKKK